MEYRTAFLLHISISILPVKQLCNVNDVDIIINEVNDSVNANPVTICFRLSF